MSDKWVTIAAAAATLEVHPRTIERRIASGKIESRRTDDGLQQVLIDLPDAPIPEPSPFETVRELAQDQVFLATGSASAIVRLAQADAERARGELLLVRQHADRARQGARFAWSIVALLAVGTCAAVGLMTHEFTTSHDEIGQLQRRAEIAEQQYDKSEAHLNAAVKDAENAKLAGAEAAGRLSAYVEQSKLQAQTTVAAKAPTSQPAIRFVERIASILSGD